MSETCQWNRPKKDGEGAADFLPWWEKFFAVVGENFSSGGRFAA